MRINLTILLALTGLLFYNCDSRRESLGADNEIMVIADVKHHDEFGNVLRQIFSDTIYTPKPEPEYNFTFVNPVGFNDIKRYTNLVIGSIGADRRNPSTDLVIRLLGEEKFQAVLNSENPIIFARDQFALNQLLMIFCAQSEDHLRTALMGKEKWIKTQYSDQYHRRQSKFLFKRSRHKNIEKMVMKKYGWGIKIPWGWITVHDSTDVNFFWLGREMPYQWLSVQWADGLTVKDSIEAVRYEWDFPERYYGSVRYNNYRFECQQADFKHWTAWKFTGIWESVDEAKGGPFISYLFYDGISDRTYHINGLIHYPGRDKILYLQQLDLIAHSFFIPE